MKLNLRSILPVVLTIVIALSISFYSQHQITANQEEITLWLAQFGPYVILVYILLQTITIVFAPLSGFTLSIVMMTLFGVETAIVLYYLVSCPVYLLNFYLGRRYGRSLVKKIVGEESLLKLDHLVKDAGVLILVMSRVLQPGNYDYLSYVWGLTTIPFKTFAIVNFLAGIPGAIISYLILSQFDNLFYGVIAFYISTVALAGLAIYLTHRIKKYQRR